MEYLKQEHGAVYQAICDAVDTCLHSSDFVAPEAIFEFDVALEWLLRRSCVRVNLTDDFAVAVSDSS